MTLVSAGNGHIVACFIFSTENNYLSKSPNLWAVLKVIAFPLLRNGRIYCNLFRFDWCTAFTILYRQP